MCDLELQRVQEQSLLKEPYRGVLAVLAEAALPSRAGSVALSMTTLTKMANAVLRDRGVINIGAVDDIVGIIAQTPELYIVPSQGRRAVSLYILTVGCERDEIERRLIANMGVGRDAAALIADEILARDYYYQDARGGLHDARPMDAYDPFDAVLIKIIASIHAKGHDRFYPKDLADHWRTYRAEWTFRKDCWRLAERGYIERIGGGKSRKGYRLHPAWQKELSRTMRYGAL